MYCSNLYCAIDRATAKCDGGISFQVSKLVRLDDPDCDVGRELSAAGLAVEISEEELVQGMRRRMRDNVIIMPG